MLVTPGGTLNDCGTLMQVKFTTWGSAGAACAVGPTAVVWTATPRNASRHQTTSREVGE
jgi:hypothetical protein